MAEKPADFERTEDADVDDEEFERIYAENEHIPLAQVKDELGIPISDEERAELELVQRENSDTEPPLKGESVPMPEIPPPPDEPLSHPPPDATPDDEPESDSEPADVQRVVISRPPNIARAPKQALPTVRQIAQKHVAAKGPKRSAGTGSKLRKKEK